MPQVVMLASFASSGQSRDRTGDLRIFSPSLYQLSYLSKSVSANNLGTVPRTRLLNILRALSVSYKPTL